MAAAIVVENVSKKYRLARAGEERLPYRTLRDEVVRWAKYPARYLRGETGGKEDFWALKDVSFEVQPGEVIGIIGRNGAGKSTLLKVLSRITKPTSGRVRLRGRVGSLLEVGTGFHPELTGRENIYLSGAVLGMKRSEIRRKFDEIVAFAEVEKFLDLAAKRYSSGMYMRLAFAVAAHLEPEILLVDEVLAVGDAQFQKKCLGKMGEVAKGGRTVLFVSHNISSVTRICASAVLFSEGCLIEKGAARDITSKYLQSDSLHTSFRSWSTVDAPGDNVCRLRAVRAYSNGHYFNNSIKICESIQIEVEYEVLLPGRIPIPNYHFFDAEGTCIFVSHAWGEKWRRTEKNPGAYRTVLTIPGNYLSEGLHTVGVAITSYIPTMTVHAHEPAAIAFRVIESSEEPNSRGDYTGHLPGKIRPLLTCNTQLLNNISL